MTFPEAMLHELLARWPVGRLATVSVTGQPHAVPVVFCGHDGVVYSPLDGKRKGGRRLERLVNLAANPMATLLLDDYAMDWRTLWWVRLDGTADWYAPPAAAAGEIAARLEEKYPQYTDPGYAFEPDAYLRLKPTKVTAWAQSGSVETIAAALARR